MSKGLGGPTAFRDLPREQQVRVLAYDRILRDPKGENSKEKQGDRGAALLGRHLERTAGKRPKE